MRHVWLSGVGGANDQGGATGCVLAVWDPQEEAVCLLRASCRLKGRGLGRMLGGVSECCRDGDS